MTKSTLVLALALTAGALAGPGVQAAKANGHGMVHIDNPTNLTINYSFRWGDGPWQKITLYPGNGMLHSWEYAPGSQYSPPFVISFDCDLSPGIVLKEYSLVRYAYPFKDWHYAKKYNFATLYGGTFLDLYSKN